MARGRFHWSWAGCAARLGPISAIAAVPLLGLVLKPSMGMLYFAIAVIVFLAWVELVKKMTLVAWFRSINIMLTGRVKSSLNLFKELKR